MLPIVRGLTLKNSPASFQRLWPCQCRYGGHSIVVRFDNGKDDDFQGVPWAVIEIASAYHPATIKERLKAAWSILWEGGCSMDSVVVGKPDLAYEISACLAEAGSALAQCQSGGRTRLG